MDAPQTTPASMIQRAINPASDKGARGFLVWVRAAFPPAYADKILAAAKRSAAQYRAIGGSATFGDAPFIDPTGGLDANVAASAAGADIPASAAPPSQSWIDNITGAIQAAGQAYLTKAQIDSAQKITDINLQRAQQGLAPLPIDPTTYGLPAPTARIGLTADTQTLLMWGAGILGGLFLIGAFAKGRR